MASQPVRRKACVIGGSGFVGAMLVKLLLHKGYIVNTTVRDPGNHKKVSHLTELQKLGELNIFQADLTDELSFSAPLEGCEYVFHVATPVNFASEDPENDMIKPAIQGVRNVLKASAKTRSVKRVVLTSSAAAVSINTLNGPHLRLTEENWTDAEFLSTSKPPNWGYPVSKTLSEKEAWKIAGENGIDLVTIVPTLIAGRSLTLEVPGSVAMATALLTGNESLVNGLKGYEMISGSISISHVKDVCRAHIFVAENESSSGRYICASVNIGIQELASLLNKRYPHYSVPTEFEDFPKKARLIISSEKLVGEGFSFEYGIEGIYDETVEYLKEVGMLKK